MGKVVRVDVNGGVEIVDAPEGYDYRWAAKQIGCDWIELVHPRRLEEPYAMIVDEEGLLKDSKFLNVAGSWLYETDKHGQPIVGNLLIIKEVYGDDGVDFGSMSEEEAERFKKDLGNRDRIHEWFCKILDNARR